MAVFRVVVAVRCVHACRLNEALTISLVPWPRTCEWKSAALPFSRRVTSPRRAASILVLAADSEWQSWLRLRPLWAPSSSAQCKQWWLRKGPFAARKWTEGADFQVATDWIGSCQLMNVSDAMMQFHNGSSTIVRDWRCAAPLSVARSGVVAQRVVCRLLRRSSEWLCVFVYTHSTMSPRRQQRPLWRSRLAPWRSPTRCAQRATLIAALKTQLDGVRSPPLGGEMRARAREH